nr:hypothetical protein [Tanacetum cinerariifolium]
MRTRSSSNLPVESPPNPSTSNPKRRNRRRSKHPFIHEESPVDMMADQRTMAELLRAPTEGYAEAIVVPSILAEQFELKHTAVNYNLGNSGYHPPGVANQIRPSGFAQPNVRNNQNRFGLPQGYNRGNNFNLEQSYQAPTQQIPLSELEKIKRLNDANMKAMQTQINNVKKELRNEMKNSIQASMSNQTNELKNMMASFFQMNIASTSGSGSLLSNTIANPKGELKAIITRSGIVLDGPSVPIPPPFVNPKEDERVDETLTDQDLVEYTIKYPSRMLKQKQQEKDEVQIYKFWQMFKQLHINITLADALVLIPKYHKMLKALLSYKEKLLELANTHLNENCLAVILKKLLEKLGDPGKFIIPCGFSELKCKALADLGDSINLMPLSVWKKLGLPELISTRMTLELANRAICTPAGIARDVFVPVDKFTFPANFFIVDYESDPRVPLILGRPFLRTARALIDVHGEEMILRDEVKDDVFYPKGGNVLPKKLLDFDSTKYLRPPYHVSTTSSSSSNQLLEEFVDELAFITYPQGNDDISFDIESNLKEIEYLLHHDPIKDIDSILKDLIDQSKLADLNDNLIDIMPEMFTDEHALDYSSPPLYDEYDDDLFKVESDTKYVYNDPFDSKGEKIKESKLLIDELDLPSDFLLSFEYDSFLSEDFFEVDALPPTTRTRYLIQDFDPPLYELPFFKEVPRSKILLLFSSENEAKVFKPRILTSKDVHSFYIPELSHQGCKVFKINQILKSPMKIFPFSRGEDMHILDVLYLHF